jgi:hypothetical protein
MKVIDIPLNAIEIGDRRRSDPGDISALAFGMKRVGQIQAIVVDRPKKGGAYRLVAGFRRIKAARMLRWKTIAAARREREPEEPDGGRTAQDLPGFNADSGKREESAGGFAAECRETGSEGNEGRATHSTGIRTGCRRSCRGVGQNRGTR